MSVVTPVFQTLLGVTDSRTAAAMAPPCVLAAGVVLSGLSLRAIAARMRSLQNGPPGARPPKQVLLELRFLPGSARALMKEWKEVGCNKVRAQVYLDFGFIVAYVIFGLSASLLLLRALHLQSSPAGLWLAAALVIVWLAAGALDATENFFLLLVLPPRSRPVWQPVAFAAALFKWQLIVIGALGPAWVLVRWLCSRATM